MKRSQAFSPGEILADELAARGWSQTDLAGVLGRPFQHVNLLINGKRRITAEIASELAAALGTSVDVWLNMQAAWDAFNAPAPDRHIAGRAQKTIIRLTQRQSSKPAFKMVQRVRAGKSGVSDSYKR